MTDPLKYSVLVQWRDTCHSEHAKRRQAFANKDQERNYEDGFRQGWADAVANLELGGYLNPINYKE